MKDVHAMMEDVDVPVEVAVRDVVKCVGLIVHT